MAISDAEFASFTAYQGKPMNLLFLRTGNSCQSQMAEGWARQLSKKRPFIAAKVYPSAVTWIFEKNGYLPALTWAISKEQKPGQSSVQINIFTGTLSPARRLDFTPDWEAHEVYVALVTQCDILGAKFDISICAIFDHC
jgi:hypothetical protein